MPKLVAGDERFVFSQDVILEIVEDEAVVVNLKSQDIFGLNETGVEVAKLIMQGCTFSEMLASLKKTYSLSIQELEPEVNTLLSTLLKQQLISRDPP